MRKVAAYAIFSASMDAGRAAERFEAASDLILNWRDGKGRLRQEEDRMTLVLKGGRVADYWTAHAVADGCKVIDHFIVEPSGNALVRTQVSLAHLPDKVAAYVELQAAGGAYQLGPMHVDIRCPNIVGKLVNGHDDWHVGESPVRTRPFEFNGNDGARQLENLIWKTGRNLPVVVISSFEDAFLTETLVADLAADLVGVALVATIDAAASWALTKSRGQEWSCFNGAVRLYWPKLEQKSKPLHNPIWTRHALLSQSAAPQDAASKLTRQLRRQLLGLSAFAMLEPVEFAATRSAHAREVSEAAKAELRDSMDWEGLANSYASDNEVLRADIASKVERVNDLEAQVANLQLFLQWSPEQETEIAPDTFLPPTTVQEAVDSARRQFGEQLIFGDDVDKGVGTLASDAGPPDKVLNYLEKVAEMVSLRRGEGLGQAPVKWFNNQGFRASGESETTKSSADERRKRTWHDGSGRRVFDLHLKPTEGVHPDRCVRIYLDYDEQRNVALVGWVGRHPE
jgi:hypothetical protein